MIIEVRMIYRYINISPIKKTCVISLSIYVGMLANRHVPGNWIVSQPCTICLPPRRNTQLGWTSPGWSSRHLRRAWIGTSRMPSTTCSSPASRCRCFPPEHFRFLAIFPFRHPSPRWLTSSRDPLWRSSPAPRCPTALVLAAYSLYHVSRTSRTVYFVISDEKQFKY